MGAFANTALRALWSIATMVAICAAGCGSITVSEAVGAPPDAGVAVGGMGGGPDVGGNGGGPDMGGMSGGPAAGGAGGRGATSGCLSDKDCHGDKLKRCDVAGAVCVACLTADDCDGSRACTAGTCAAGND
jgi:hypothetical protein